MKVLSAVVRSSSVTVVGQLVVEVAVRQWLQLFDTEVDGGYGCAQLNVCSDLCQV